jgi:hypothetical protein
MTDEQRQVMIEAMGSLPEFVRAWFTESEISNCQQGIIRPVPVDFIQKPKQEEQPCS